MFIGISHVWIHDDITLIEMLVDEGRGLIYEYYAQYPDSADLYYKIGYKYEDRLENFQIESLIEEGYFNKEGAI